MTNIVTDEAAIGVTAFKSQCLNLIDQVAQGKKSRIVLMKHNRPVAAVVPIEPEEENLNTLQDVWGAMRGVGTIPPGVDIMEPTGEVWKAER